MGMAAVEEEEIPDTFTKAKLKEHVNVHVLGNVIPEASSADRGPSPSAWWLGGAFHLNSWSFQQSS